jgi:hypothetical protein
MSSIVMMIAIVIAVVGASSILGIPINLSDGWDIGGDGDGDCGGD